MIDDITYLCSISVQWLAHQPSKLRVTVRVCYTGPKRQLGLPLLSKERVVYPARKQRASAVTKVG